MVHSFITVILLIGVVLAPARSFAADARDGARAFKAQDYAKAEEAFQSAVRQDPTNLDQWYNLGVSQYKQGKLNEAKESFSRAAQHPRPDGKMRALYNLGNTQAMLQQFDAAKQAYQQALSYDLNNQAIKDNLAWVEEQLKNPPQQQEQQQQDQKNDQQQDQKDEQQKQESKESQQSQSQKNDPKKQQQSPEKSQQNKSEAEDQKKQDDQQKQGDSTSEKPDENRDQSSGEESSQNQGEAKQLEREDAERVLRQVEDQLGRNRVQDQGDGEAKGQKNDW